MYLKVDDDVMALIEYAQEQIPAGKLLEAARALSDLAPLLWGHYLQNSLSAIRVAADPIVGSRTQSSAIESVPWKDRAACDFADTESTTQSPSGISIVICSSWTSCGITES